MSESLSLFPLQTVLFPGERLPLRIFEPRYVDLVRDCLRNETGFGVVAIKEGRETGSAATPHRVGTLAKICEWDQGQDGLLQIVVEGSDRFAIQSIAVAQNQLSIAQVEWLPTPAQAAKDEEVVRLQALLNKLDEQIPTSTKFAPAPNSASALAYRWAQLLPLTLARKVELLSAKDDQVQLTLINQELAILLDRSRRN
jgi:Lon protease-like protein